MQTSDKTGPTEPGKPGRAGSLGVGIARGAAVVAGLTILSRLLGLGRTLVFAQTVGASCLGTAYVTDNQVPNLLYELIVGGALTSAMVPILARSAEQAADDRHCQDCSDSGRRHHQPSAQRIITKQGLKQTKQ